MTSETLTRTDVMNGQPLSTSTESLTDIYGSSLGTKELLADIEQAARSHHAVLILGESGTGKTTAAQMIHTRSQRCQNAFVDVNCAALPEALLESELFGHEKGAFTGALREKKGLFEVGEGGTLFLDEIGELKPELQAKLLKAIEQQKIRRVGGIKEIHCNVRILAASSRNLQRMVKLGTFREDLYYRLAILEISVRPLRDRNHDIPELVEQQLAVEQRNGRLSEPIEIEPNAVKELAAYRWPGNIRQLHNVIARLSSHFEPGHPIRARQVRTEIARFQELDGDTIVLPDSCSVLLSGESLEDFSCRVRGEAIESVKTQLHGNMNRAARRLKVDPASLHRIIHRILTLKAAKTHNTDMTVIAA